jgi:hypothetical protein
MAMNHDTSMAVMAVAVVGSVAIMVKSIADAVVRYAEGRRQKAPDAESASDARLARLEVAVESIAVEIERISEGQRFTTRLLNSQFERPTPRFERPEKFDTPH